LKSAYSKYLKKIEIILNTRALLTISDFKSSPLENIKNIAHEFLSKLRRIKFNLLYAARTKRNKDNHVNKHIDNCSKETENEDIFKLFSNPIL